MPISLAEPESEPEASNEPQEETPRPPALDLGAFFNDLHVATGHPAAIEADPSLAEIYAQYCTACQVALAAAQEEAEDA